MTFELINNKSQLQTNKIILPLIRGKKQRKKKRKELLDSGGPGGKEITRVKAVVRMVVLFPVIFITKDIFPNNSG